MGAKIGSLKMSRPLGNETRRFDLFVRAFMMNEQLISSIFLFQLVVKFEFLILGFERELNEIIRDLDYQISRKEKFQGYSFKQKQA
jgi:hypothetical protein